MEFLFKAPLALIARGGVLGMIQLGLYKEVLDFIDRPSSTTSTKAIGKHEKTHNQRVREFIGDVQDGNDLLSRLAATGYFD